MTQQQLSRHEVETDDRLMFGFWIYLMTDLLMFAVLFACYAVLRGSTNGGETAGQLFSQPQALLGTVILLTSSFTCGIAMIAARQRDKAKTLIWLGVTFALGLAFLTIEFSEFTNLIHEGHTPQSSAFLSSFFVLVGTHWLHIASGLLWMAVTMAFIVKRGLNKPLLRKLGYLSLFWHFLDIVWIFIFTIVYLMAGV